MGKKFSAFLFLIVCGLGIVTWMGGQNFDVRGFSLSERESMLSVAGRSTSGVFELNPGYYEFTVHRYQHGEHVSEQIFPFGQWGYDDIDLIDALRIQNRELLAISFTNVNEGVVNLDMNIRGMRFGGINMTEIEENAGFTWGSIEERLQLGDTEVPLMYFALSNGRWPMSFDSIFGSNFRLEDNLATFRDLPELFIVTIRKISQ